VNGRTALGLLIFGIAAVISFLINRGDDVDGSRDEAGLPEGYYLKGVALTGTDAMGAIKYTLHAREITHDPAEGGIALEDIALDYGSSEAPWTVRADRGRMPGTSNEISLSGNVAVESDHLNKSGHTMITSNSLLVSIDNQTATTQDAVRITVGRGSLQGRGMEVDFANEQVSILSDVKGSFDPPPQ